MASNRAIPPPIFSKPSYFATLNRKTGEILQYDRLKHESTSIYIKAVNEKREPTNDEDEEVQLISETFRRIVKCDLLIEEFKALEAKGWLQVKSIVA